MDVQLSPSLRSLLEFDWGLCVLATVTVLIALEATYWRIRRRPLDVREDASSIGVGIGYFLINVVLVRAITYSLHLHIYRHYRLFTCDISSGFSWGALLVLGDFAYYWVHRAEHRVRLLWCAHENHHSARQYSFSTAIRMPWGEIFYKPVLGLWQPLLGFHPIMYPILDAFNLTMGLLQHTEVVGKLGWLEWIFATPSHHRVHHGTETEYIDKNYGARLILWDRMFGTFAPERTRPRYGLVEDIDTHNPLKIVTHGYVALARDLKKTPKIKDKLLCMLKPPSWRSGASRP